MMSRKQSLPYDAEVEYLQVDDQCEGLPYIDTGYIPTGFDNEIYIDFQYFMERSPNISTDFASAITSNNVAGYGLPAYLKSYLRARNGSSNNGGVNIYFSTTTRRQFLMHADGSIDRLDTGTSYSPVALDGEDANTSTFKLFGNENACAYGAIYSLKLSKAGVTVLDLVPVRKGAEGFMYDKVSGQLFGNSGTGRFIVGPDI